MIGQTKAGLSDSAEFDPGYAEVATEGSWLEATGCFSQATRDKWQCNDCGVLA